MSDQPAAVLDFNANFQPARKWMLEARARRKQHADECFPFGISYLDDYCSGIHPTDFVLIGAATGAGKTTLATMLAHNAAAQGKRVHFFALEAYPGEIEERALYQELVQRAWADKRPGRDRISFSRWRFGRCKDVLTETDELDAMRAVDERMANIQTYYRDREFTARDIRRLFLLVQNETDLIVFDHVHFVDSDDSNENRALKDITKALRDSAIAIGKPVISIAHLRKTDRLSRDKVPSIGDFHGSSDLTKIVTKAILLAPDRDITPEGGMASTYMHIAKDRYEGACRYTARMVFNMNLQKYSKNYDLGHFEGKARDFVMCDSPPWWAERARR